MTKPTQTIDISPERVAPIAQAGLRLLNLETTLVPGNLRAQIGVLEVYLSGLASNQLVLAPTEESAVDSGTKQPDSPTGPEDDGGTQESTDSSGSAGEIKS